jgi:hypothetical protein
MAVSAELIKQVIKEQSSLTIPKDFIQRTAYQTLQKYAELSEIVVITGLRRVGKSTLLQQLRQKSKESNYYINFDDDRLVHFTFEDFQILYEIFIELYGVQNTFYFDEIQNIPEWERFVRRLHDQGKKVYVTGSNATLFSQELGTRLTGRYIQLEMYPYSFSEMLKNRLPAVELKDTLTTEERGLVAGVFREYYLLGGIPPYVHSDTLEVLQGLYESVLYRDIIVRYKLSNDRPIKELVYYFASNVGKEFSYNALAKQIGLGSGTTVADYCHYLSMSYLCYSVPRFSHSLAKQQLYNKKCYFVDHAMARVLGFRSTEDNGRLLENLVYIELCRRGGEIYFHKEQQECDFLVRRKGQIIAALQVCWELHSPETRKREILGLREAMIAYGLNAGTILTNGQEETFEVELNDTTGVISVLPVWKWAGNKEIATR